MKKRNRMFIATLMAVLVAVMVMIPVYAAAGSKSERYTEGAYSGRCTLTLTDTSGEATMSAAVTGSGAVLPDAVFRLSGVITITGKDGEVYLNKSGFVPSGGASLTISDSKELSTESRTLSATCTYSLLGTTVCTLHII